MPDFSRSGNVKTQHLYTHVSDLIQVVDIRRLQSQAFKASFTFAVSKAKFKRV